MKKKTDTILPTPIVTQVDKVLRRGEAKRKPAENVVVRSPASILIPLRDVTGQLYLREDWASGEFNGKEFDVTRNADGKAILIAYNDKQYLIALSDIVQSCLAEMSK